MVVSVRELRRCEVMGRDGQPLGPLSDLMFDERTWQVRYLTVDARAWLTRRVPLHPLAVRSCDPARRRITLDLTRSQIERAPAVNADKPISRPQAERYYRHFAWPAYWAPSAGGFQATSASGDDGDPQLFPALSLGGLAVCAGQDRAGRIDDQLADVSSWGIDHLVVERHGWWSRRKVLIATRFAQRIDWTGGEMHLDVELDALDGGSAWQQDTPLSKYFEARLARPDGWPPVS
jgi:hypothetical protein